MSQSYRPALLVIDLQEDFLPPDGSLAVPNGRDVIPVINSLTELPWTTIIASKDWHPSNHCSFAVNHPGKKPFEKASFSHPEGTGAIREETLWPVHCVQGSHGSEFPPEFTGASKVDNVVNKGYLEDREYYSAFQDIWKLHKTELASLLKEKDVTDVFVVGLALDYCVLNTAVDAVSFGFKTHLIKEGTRPVDPSVTDQIYEKLKNAGVEITDIKSLPPFSN